MLLASAGQGNWGEFHLGLGGYCDDVEPPVGYWCASHPPRGQVWNKTTNRGNGWEQVGTHPRIPPCAAPSAPSADVYSEYSFVRARACCSPLRLLQIHMSPDGMWLPRAARYRHPEDAVVQAWRGGMNRPMPVEQPAGFNYLVTMARDLDFVLEAPQLQPLLGEGGAAGGTPLEPARAWAAQQAIERETETQRRRVQRQEQERNEGSDGAALLRWSPLSEPEAFAELGGRQLSVGAAYSYDVVEDELV